MEPSEPAANGTAPTERTWHIARDLTTKRHRLTTRGAQERLVASVEFETVAPSGQSPARDFNGAGVAAVKPQIEADLLKQIPERDEVKHARRLAAQVQEATYREALAAARIAELDGKRKAAVLVAGPGLGKALKDIDGELSALRAERADAAAERATLQTEFVSAKSKAVTTLQAIANPIKQAAVARAMAAREAAEQALGAAVGSKLEALLIADIAVLHALRLDMSLVSEPVLERILGEPGAPGTETTAPSTATPARETAPEPEAAAELASAPSPEGSALVGAGAGSAADRPAKAGWTRVG